MKSLFPPVVTQIGHDIVHDINQQWNDSLLLIAVEHHVQQVSQYLMISKEKKIPKNRHFCSNMFALKM